MSCKIIFYSSNLIKNFNILNYLDSLIKEPIRLDIIKNII
jgi:hypothetical protein